MCEQREIPFYFLRSDDESLTVSFCKIINWPNEIRESFRGLIREAYQAGVKSNDAAGKIIASKISEEELVSNGYDCQFDLNKLEGILDDDVDVNNLFRNIINECFQLISKSKYRGVKKGPFLVWMFQRKGVFGASGDEQEAVILIISPFYNERSPRATNEIEPCYEYLQSIESFIRMESANPLFENALPIYMYDNGDIQRIELDGVFLETAAVLQDDLLTFNQIDRDNHLNIYRYLLEDQ